MQRNISIDILKGIACIFIVFIHAPFPDQIGSIIKKLAQFGVPVFFLCSGFFATYSDKEKLKKSIKHILQLIAICYVLNLLRFFIQHEYSIFSSISDLRSSIFTTKNLIGWLLFNHTFLAGVAWFLFALLYCYIFQLLTINQLSKFRLYIILFLLTGGAIINMFLPYSWTSFGWLSCGLLFFLTGQLIRVKKASIYNFKIPYIISVCLLGTALLIISEFVISWVWYYGAILLSTGLFVLSLCIPTSVSSKLSALAALGNRYGFGVYIGHPLAIHLLKDTNIATPEIHPFLFPVFVLILSIISVILIFYLKDKYATGKQRAYRMD